MSTICKRSMQQRSIRPIKVPHIELEGDAAYFARFDREQEIGSRLDHPGVVKIVAVDSKSRAYIVME